MQEGVNHKKRRCSPLPRSQSHPGNAAFTGGLRRKRIHVIFRYNHSISRSPCPCPGPGPCPTPCEISLHFSVQNERTTGRVKAISSGAPFRPPTRCCLSILHSPWCTFSIPLSLFIAVSVSLATFSGTRRDDAPICYLPLLLQQFQGRIGSRQRRTTKKGANKTTAQEESQERSSRKRTRT